MKGFSDCARGVIKKGIDQEKIELSRNKKQKSERCVNNVPGMIYKQISLK